MRQQPLSSVLDVRAGALRWECEGLPSVARDHSNFPPSAFGIQQGVQGVSQSPARSPQVSELNEMRQLLKQQ